MLRKRRVRLFFFRFVFYKLLVLQNFKKMSEMNNKKELILITLLITFLSVLNSCKKGEGDPRISFRSRKDRVVGNWKIVSWKENTNTSSTLISNTSESFVETENIRLEIDENKVRINTVYKSTSDNASIHVIADVTGEAIAKIDFNSDGTFKKTIEYKNAKQTVKFIGYANNQISTISSSSETIGTWNFLGDIEKDYKNKERIILNILKDTYLFNYQSIDNFSAIYSNSETFLNGERSEILNLNTLKNKEIVLEGELSQTKNNNYSTTYLNNQYPNSNSSTVSYYKSGDIYGKLIQ
jgi:hypothetical protein